METIAFRPLARGDFPLLANWFAEPAVARWWNQSADATSIEAKYGPRVAGREPTSMWIAEVRGDAAGLLQHYLHADYPEHDACVGTRDAVGIDYLLGSSHRGRRLAPLVLREFAACSLRHRASASVCVATPAQSNEPSWRALERAGFTRRGSCQPPDEPIAFVYAISRRELAAPEPAI